MKKQIKKLVALICVMVMVISLVPTVAGAARVGDVTGYAQPTDIIATINGYQLESYNVNGLTYICVEDLRYYGFDVYYDNSTRSLSVARNAETNIDPQNTNPNFWNIGSNKSRKPILYTDIVTYVNNSYVASSNINGQTIINFNELSVFGTVNYDNSRREISIVIDDINYNQTAEIAQKLQDNVSRGYLDMLIRAKGNVLVLICTFQEYLTYNDIRNFIDYSIPNDKEEMSELVNAFKSNGLDISSIYVEYLNYDGSYITSYQVN